MPKIGSHRIPNHDIETVIDLMEEAYSRVNISSGPLDEETFQTQVLQRKGGSYSRYRFDLQLYGFLEREHGADEVEINERFINIVDPVPQKEKQEAIVQALNDVKIFRLMYKEGFDPETSTTDLRVWLIQSMNVPKSEAKTDNINQLLEKYKPAYRYFEESGSISDKNGGLETEESKDDEQSQDTQRSEFDEERGSSSSPNSVPLKDAEFETIQIGDKYIRLPKDNIVQEWTILKATVDAYINSIQEDED